jgi:hypothetical protein
VPGAGLAIGALHHEMINVITFPFVLYAFACLTGAGEWQRIGVAPRRPRGLAAAVAVLAALTTWIGAITLDQDGHRWALPAAGVAVPLLLTAGRIGLTRLQRRSWLEQ